MNITRRSLFGILAGAAAAPAIPAPSTPIEDVRRAMGEIWRTQSGTHVSVMFIVPPREVVDRMIARAIVKAHERQMADPRRRLEFPVGP